MQAVILAGGRGTRLRPLTYEIPKPMIPVLDRPFLFYPIQLLKSSGIRNIVLCTGHLGNVIEDYCKDGGHLGVSVSYSREDHNRILGTGGALKNAESLLEERFVLLNGDTYLAIDYSEMFRAHSRLEKSALIAAYKEENPGHCNLLLDDSNEVLAYAKKETAKGFNAVDAGAVILRKSVLQLIPPQAVCSLEEEIYTRLIGSGKMNAFICSEKFYDIGTPERIKIFSRFLEEISK